MANMVRCLHPMTHRVEVHIAGSAAAMECHSMPAGNSGSKLGSIKVPSAATSPRVPRKLSTDISNYELFVLKTAQGEYMVTGEFQITASNEDDAYEIAESSFWDQGDCGISATNVGDNQWDVVTQFPVKAVTILSAREIASKAFVEENPTVNLS